MGQASEGRVLPLPTWLSSPAASLRWGGGPSHMEDCPLASLGGPGQAPPSPGLVGGWGRGWVVLSGSGTLWFLDSDSRIQGRWMVFGQSWG